MIEIFTGKTVEEAKEQAVSAFGASLQNIHFEILEEPKRGLFGRLKGEAKVKAEYEPMLKQTPVMPAKQAAPARVKPAVTAAPAAQTVTTATATTTTATTQTAAPATKTVTVTAETTAPTDIPAGATFTAPAATAAPTPAPTVTSDAIVPAADAASDAAPETLNAENQAKLDLAIDYISSILRQMGLSDAHTVSIQDGGAVVCFDGDGTGTLIGRRGDTLDALQYLASMIANKGDKEYFRITLDSCGYREKRRKTLEELAAKIAAAVLRNGRSTTLEPMNPYERRIIHSAVSAIEGVSSRSVGEEPFRKVIISSTNPRNTARKDGDRPERRPGAGNRSGNPHNNRDRKDQRGPRRPNNGEGPRKLDLSTSFEKDYKRPRPEDDINAGLYGKIEF